MSDQTSTSSSSGPGFTSLLTLLFIALKLTHVIDWSWWWVLSPIWIGFALALALFLLVGLGYGIYCLVKVARR